MTLLTQQKIDRRLAALRPEEMKAKAAGLGCQWDGSGLQIRFFGHHYRVSPGGIHARHGPPPGLAVKNILADYAATQAATAKPTDARISFREFPGAGPLVVAFANNTHKIIAHTFGADLARLKAACGSLQGRFDAAASGFDLAVEFMALPKVPLYLQFNASDEDFPAEATLVFDPSAAAFLSLHSLFSTATYLTGSLITSG